MLQRLRSIRWKIIALYLVLLIATLSLSGYFLQKSLESYFRGWLEKKLIKEMNLILTSVNPLIENKESLSLNRLIRKYGRDLGTRITIIDAEGKVLADSRENPLKMENHLYRPEVQEVLEGQIGKETRYSTTLDIKMKYVALPIEKKGQIIGIIRASLTLDKLNKLYRGIWSVLLQAGFIAILISILLSLKLTNHITDPIQEITSVAQKIANGFLDQKLIVRTRDEVGQLANMFNHMVNRVKEKVQEISSEKNKIEAIVTSIGDAVIAVNDQGEVILFNSASEKIFSIKEEEILSKSVIQVTKNYRLDELVNQSLIEEQTITEEIEILLPEQRIFRVQIAPIEGDNKAIGVVAVLRDITDIRRLEEIRKEFVGNVSHELKTPLTSIKGYVETLLDSNPDHNTYQSFLQVINDEANRLERLIEDLLNLSKIESNVNYFTEEDVDMIEVINNTLFLLENKANNKKIDLNLDLPFELPKVKGDQDQLSRLMINLIDNAIKYTPEGGMVKIKAYQKEGELVVEVEDNGMGIPKEDLPRIFERFYRVDKARSRKLGGTGLGLSIVKHIVEQHDGEITVDSEVEEGTKFTLKLPLK